MNTKGLAITITTFLLAACSAETNQPTEQPSAPANPSPSGSNGGGGGASGSDTNSSGSTTQTPNPTSDDGAITGCDSPPPSLPQVSAEFKVGQSAPRPKGGDEKGTWIVTKVTTLLPASAGLLLKVDESSGEGSGFVKFDGKRFLTFSDTTMTLATRGTGKTVTSGVSIVAGTYTYANGVMTVTAECTKSTPEGAGEMPKELGFSRISDTEALFQQTGDSQIGEVTLLMSLKKAN